MSRAKNHRDLALTLLIDLNKKLTGHIAHKQDRLAEKRYSEIKQQFEKFEKHHVEYAYESKIGMDDPSMKDVFFEAAGVMDTAEVAWNAYTEQLENKRRVDEKKEKDRQKAEDIAKSKKLAEQAAKRKMKLVMENLQLHVDSTDVTVEGDAPDPATLKGELLDLQQQYESAVTQFEGLFETATDDQLDSLEEEQLKNDTAWKKGVFKIRSYINKKMPDPSRESSPSRGDSRGAVTLDFKTEKIGFPTFSGDIRAFATFKRDFEDIVIDTGKYEKKHMSHILRNQCLDGEAKKLVQNINDFDIIWQKLVDKYDDKLEVIELITRQIASLKVLDNGDYQGIVNLVDVVEKADMDLQAAGKENVLNNPMTVRLILQKCPRDLREAVTRELNKTVDEDEFRVMLEFLVVQRRDAQRLARLSGEKKTAVQKVKVNAAAGKAKDNSSGGSSGKNAKKTNFECITTGCMFKKRHFLSECRAFKRMTVDEKGTLIRDKKLCVLCFGEHAGAACPKKTAGWKECDIGGCGRWHSRLLHGANVPGLALVAAAEDVYNLTGAETTILLVQKIRTGAGVDATTFWDNGSTVSLVTFKFAEAAGLQGIDCGFELTGVGDNTEVFSTKLFSVPLIDRNGEIRIVHAFGMKKITSDVRCTNMEVAADIFNVDVAMLDRPTGEVDLLVGMADLDVMPTKEKVVGKLGLFVSDFGTGLVVGGRHSSVCVVGEVDNFAQQVCHAEARVIRPTDFITAEGFGVDIPRRCRHCRGCKECGYKAGQLSWTDNMELAEIEKGLTLDTVNKVWTSKYPYKQDPSILRNNYCQAVACMKSLEKRLLKNNNMEKFNEQFKDAVDRQVFVEIKEDEEYDGPVNYITMTEAFKDGEGVTTPLRLCMNSSMKYQGISLNDILMKGPSSLNNIYSILLNFRTYPVAFVKDVAKFYNSVIASERDQHLRRVIWRNCDQQADVKIYKTRCVNFGDKPAGAVALTAMRNTADLYRSIDEEAADKLRDDSYVDDTSSGADTRERAVELSMNMEKIAAMGGFKFKKTTMSGDDADPIRILGTGWDTRDDTLFLEVKVNTSNKVKGLRKEPDIELDDILNNFPDVLTKRIIWRIVLGQFDLLGLASVFFIRLKLLMRDLSDEEGRKLDWDEAVQSNVKERFVKVLLMLKEVKTLRFKRCVKPVDRDEESKPDLLMFGDGSQQAFCTLAYIRWRLSNGEYRCYLLTGKTRVAPLRKISVPRIELLGAVASVRLAETIQQSVKFEFGNRYFFTDSSAVFGMITGESGSFMEFVGTRTGEIKSKSDPGSEWFWLPTQDNLADLGTRDDVTPEMIAPESIYINGLDWMREPTNVWPVNQHPCKVPTEELIPVARSSAVATGKITAFDTKRFKSFKKAVGTLANVFFFLHEKKLVKGLLNDCRTRQSS